MTNARYQSICERHGSVPLLMSVVVISFLGGTVGCYYLVALYYLGIVAASLGEDMIMKHIRKQKYGVRRGSEALRMAQVACVALAFFLGTLLEYGLSAQAQHDFQVLHSGTRSALAQIIEASR